MSKKTISLLVVLCIFMPFFSAVLSKEPPKNLATYIVELHDYTGGGERSLSLLSSSHETFKDRVLQTIPEAQFQGEMMMLSSSCLVKCDSGNIEDMKNMPEVASIRRARLIYPMLHNSTVTTRAKEAWELLDKKGLKITGKGTLIGIIDTGLNYMHASLGSDFGPGAKVTHGYDFGDLDDDPRPDEDWMPFDHGTHCAGIAAGSNLPGIASGKPVPPGIAPDANLGAYKVFADEYYTFDFRVMQAIERAYSDGCDVISMSLGMSGSFKDDPLARLIKKVTEKGMVVVAAAANSHLDKESFPKEGEMMSPGGADDSICAAACDDSARPVIRLDGMTIYPEYLQGSNSYPKSVKGKIVDCKAGKPEDIEGLELKDAICVVSRPEKEEYYDMARMFAMKEALGLIIYNNKEGDYIAAIDKYEGPIEMFFMTVYKEDGEKLIANNGTEIDMTLESKLGFMSVFSSWGPTTDGRLKPDVAAPGVNVLSAFGYNSYIEASGTSMATPTIAGCSALVVQAHPDWSAYDVRSAIVNYATTLKDRKGKVYPVLAQGTGRVDVYSSVKAPALFSPTSLSFGYITGQAKAALTIKNVSDKPISFTPVLMAENDDTKAKFDKIDIAPGKSKTINIALEPQTTKEGSHAGYIMFDNGAAKAKVAYLYRLGAPPKYELVDFIDQKILAFSPNGDRRREYFYMSFFLNEVVGGQEASYTYTNEEGEEKTELVYFDNRENAGGPSGVFWDGMSEFGRPMPEGKYSFNQYLLPKGKDPKVKDNWLKFGPYTTWLDVTPPKITFDPYDKIVFGGEKAVIKGKVSDALMDTEALGKNGISQVYVRIGEGNPQKTPLSLDDEGNFSFELPLKRGKNIFTVFVHDKAENVGRNTETVSLLKKAELKVVNGALFVNDAEIGKLSQKNNSMMIELQTWKKITDEILAELDGNLITIALDEKKLSLRIGSPLMVAADKTILCEAPYAEGDKVFVDFDAVLKALGAESKEKGQYTLVWKGK